MTARGERLDDWEALAAAWRTLPDEAPAADLPDALRAHVRERRVELWAVVACEVAITLVAAWIVARALASEVTPRTVTAAVMVALQTAIVWAFTTWNRRGTWRALSESREDYLRLTRKRIAAGRRTVTFVRWVVGLGATACAVLLAFGVVGEVWRWGIAVLYLGGFWGWSVWYARRLARDDAMVRFAERE